MNRLLTGGCFIVLAVLAGIVVLMCRAIRENAMRNDDFWQGDEQNEE